MGLFSKKPKSIVEPVKRIESSKIELPDRENRERPSEITDLAQKYLNGEWDQVIIGEGDSVDFHLDSWADFSAIKESLASGGAIFESLTKSRTKVYITDSSHLETLTNSITNSLRWRIPITNLETFAKSNPNFAPDMELRGRFKNWLNAPDERAESIELSNRLGSVRSGGEKIPGLSYFSSFYESTAYGKLVFVDKRKEATDLIVRDLKLEAGDGFIVACSLAKDFADEKIISVKYKNLEIGQIPAKKYDHFKYLFENNWYSNLNILGVLDSKGKVQAYIESTYNK
jgi:hypothetical protein